MRRADYFQIDLMGIVSGHKKGAIRVMDKLKDRNRPDQMMDPTGEKAMHRPRRLRPSGGYRQLRSFQTATLIYDGTVSFCERFINPRSRTHDQMVQAARSGRQNIAEGNRAGATSGSSETHLTNVARASLDELLLDFEDFLRQRKHTQWNKNDPEALAVRTLGKLSNPTDPTDQTDPTDSTENFDRRRGARYAPWLENNDPCIVANTLICLIHQANYLLDQQIAALERSIIDEGGYREQLTAARLAKRGKKPFYPSDPTDRSDRTDKNAPPACPRCGKPMKQRIARQGKNTGARFWGCAGYPECRGTIPLDGR